jgi:hypothetical protein
MQTANIPVLAGIALGALAVWLLITRFRSQLTINWPLLYYLGLVLFVNYNPTTLNHSVVYGGVVCGFLLRFEFMNARFTLLIRALEGLALAYIGYTLAQFVRAAF